MAKRRRVITRSQRQARSLDAAAGIIVPQAVDVCVLGGGAAGLVAAICAAERGSRTVVLERGLECGKTILATGNGRCNFANAALDQTLYNDPSFVRAVCGDSWLQDILSFFETSGLAWVEEAHGRMYPISRQAASVRNVLLHRAQRAGVILAPAREVMGVARDGKGFVVSYDECWDGKEIHAIHSAAIVLASGGASEAPLGGLELKRKPAIPLLCPLSCTHPLLSELDGRRVHAMAHLLRHGRAVAQERGEVLFRAYGLSGIAIFNLSRHAQAGDVVCLDLLPDIAEQQARKLAIHTFDGLLDPVIARGLSQLRTPSGDPIALAKHFELCVEGTAEVDHAQVHRGGLEVNQFEPSTLETRRERGVFACGEALDIDGPCGGYNLAWAWKSGMVAGTAAAEEASL